MKLLDGLSLWATLGLFAAAAALVWFAGTHIARYAEAISKKTGLGQAVLGVLLLGGVTSLPEVAVTAGAAATGYSALAVNNILGGVAIQVAILAVADAVSGRRALSAIVPDSTVLLQGSLCIVLLAVTAAGIVIGDVAVLGAGIWLWVLLAMFLYGIRIITRSRSEPAWVATNAGSKSTQEEGRKERDAGKDSEVSLSAILVRTGTAAALILVAGFVLSQTGEAIAQQTGLGSNFVGAVLVAVATSLPELSTTLSAARLGLYTMAVSDIFGTNLFDLALLFLIDAVGGGEPVLNQVGRFSVAGAILGILVTALFLAGLAERRDRTVLYMGIDSFAVLVVYIAGLGLLYELR